MCHDIIPHSPLITKIEILKLQEDSHMQRCFTSKNGLLYFKDRLFIPTESGLTSELLQEFHTSPLGGHSGIQATAARLSSSFYWPGMHKDVKQFVNSCTMCQQNKYSTHAPYGLLQPLPIPRQVWEEIFVDFITNLPNANNKTVIWVAVDRLSKFAHFIPLPSNFTAVSLAHTFVSEIYRLHDNIAKSVSIVGNPTNSPNVTMTLFASPSVLATLLTNWTSLILHEFIQFFTSPCSSSGNTHKSGFLM